MIYDKSAIHPAIEQVRVAITEAVSVCTGAGVLTTSGMMTELKDMHGRVIEIQRELSQSLSRPDVITQPPKIAPGRELPDLSLETLQPFCQSITPKDLHDGLVNVGRLGSTMIQFLAGLQRARRIKPGLYKYLTDLAEVMGTSELS